MVNLIKYREWAVYADGRETDLTGREANALYNPVEFLSAIGARVVFSTEVDDRQRFCSSALKSARVDGR